MKTRLSLLALLLSVAGLAQNDTLPEMNQKILAYAESKIGNKVGDGVCGTLVKEAILHADRKWEKKLKKGELKNKNPYGRLIDAADALPGDIVVFKKCTFKDGLKTATSHVAIIQQSDYADKGIFDVINQNDGAKKIKDSVVKERHLNINDIVAGKVFFYRYEK